MKTHLPILTLSITALAALPIRRFVALDGDLCGAGEKALGVSEIECDSADQASVNALGVILVEAGAAIAAKAAVESDATGRAITLDTGAANGYALDAASGAGEIIRIVRGI